MNSQGLGRDNLPVGPALGDEGFKAKWPSKESERWLRSVLQNTSDVISISGPDGTIRYVTPSVERVLGYRPEELVGTSGLDYAHPDDVGRMIEALAEAEDNPRIRLTVEVRCRHKDGSWRYLEVSDSSLPATPTCEAA